MDSFPICLKCLLAHSPSVGCNESERASSPSRLELTEEQIRKGRESISAREIEADYMSLNKVLLRAYDQAARGKGKERHASDLPFDEQPMQSLSGQLGSEAGLIFQACKKATEGFRMGDPERTIREYLGAINYLAGAVIFLEKKMEAKNGVS